MPQDTCGVGVRCHSLPSGMIFFPELLEPLLEGVTRGTRFELPGCSPRWQQNMAMGEVRCCLPSGLHADRDLVRGTAGAQRSRLPQKDAGSTPAAHVVEVDADKL